MSAATSEAISGKADALVVIGAEMKQTGLDGLTQTVTEDVYYNVKVRIFTTYLSILDGFNALDM